MEMSSVGWQGAVGVVSCRPRVGLSGGGGRHSSKNLASTLPGLAALISGACVLFAFLSQNTKCYSCDVPGPGRSRAVRPLTGPHEGRRGAGLLPVQMTPCLVCKV
ncbi:hypothetical protein E2C01_041674 [Portunus trituberculatus]|uniref:Uncharacterized protein n=1 Tax=Portunus trituberculatus TaxID=210409 RepID=A0A5B7FSC5_PORTR|nr:hypothetical protein [Portunus trituberculatus]